MNYNKNVKTTKSYNIYCLNCYKIMDLPIMLDVSGRVLKLKKKKKKAPVKQLFDS
jgi:hypothetical protein